MLRASAAALIGATVVSFASAAEVRLRSSVACAAPIVRLADVAEIRAEDAALVEALALIAICPAPAAGIEQALTQHQIRQHLILSGVEPAQITITGSEEVLLLTDKASSSAPRTLPKAGAVQKALHTIESQTSRAVPPRPTSPTPPPPTAADAKAKLLVERGASVTIHSQKPGIRITAPGKALQSGAAGELIGVEVGDSKERVMVRIVGPQVVEVASSTSPPPQSIKR